jgi:hypothetical protein
MLAPDCDGPLWQYYPLKTIKYGTAVVKVLRVHDTMLLLAGKRFRCSTAERVAKSRSHGTQDRIARSLCASIQLAAPNSCYHLQHHVVSMVADLRVWCLKIGDVACAIGPWKSLTQNIPPRLMHEIDGCETESADVPCAWHSVKSMPQDAWHQHRSVRPICRFH